jgi:hypothetical protein
MDLQKLYDMILDVNQYSELDEIGIGKCICCGNTFDMNELPLEIYLEGIEICPICLRTEDRS